MYSDFDSSIQQSSFNNFIFTESQVQYPVQYPMGFEIYTHSAWTNAEDFDLSYIWCHFSTNSIPVIHGNDQSEEIFWKKITTNYNKKHYDRKRPLSSLKDRWGKINRQTQCFESQMNKIKQTNPNGMGGELNLRHAANKLFLSSHSPENKFLPHYYQFMHCYDLLSKHSKWKSSTAKGVQTIQSKSNDKNKVQKTISNSNPGESQRNKNQDFVNDKFIAPIEIENDVIRPLGVEAAKKKQNSTTKLEMMISEANSRYIRVAEERAISAAKNLELMKDLVELKHQKQHDCIMLVDTSNMDEDQKRYWKSRKDEIIKSRFGGE